MSAYVIVEIEVLDPELFEAYKTGVPAVVAAYGGTYIARGGEIQALEGDWQPERLTLIRFENMAQARAWHASAEYRPLRAMRDKAAKSRMVLVEGL